MSTEKNNPAGQTADREIVITRVVDAPRELVWQAMTDPRHVVHWWGPRGFTTTIQEMDVRPGGVWRLVMHGPDGTEYPNKSVFTEVVPPARLVFLHGGAREGGPNAQFEGIWTFDALDDGKTQVTIRMVFPTAEKRDIIVKEYGAVEGGKQTLERLGELMARTPFILERTFDAPMATVWQAITDVEQMKRWYFGNLKEFKPEAGFQTQFDVHMGDKCYPHIWKISEVVSGRKISYRWQYGGFPGDSLVTFELTDEGGRTKLKLTHTGLETFLPEINPVLARGNFAKGWTYLIGSSLQEFLQKAAPAPDSDFVIWRLFDAPRELVWAAWTDVKQMAQWWGPRDFTNPVCEMDVRPGGAFRIVMRAPDGAEFPCKGLFREVVKPERLVMNMDCSEHPDAWHDLVIPNRDKSKKPVVEMIQTVTFEDAAGKTKLTIRTTFESAALRDSMVKMGMNEGWSQSLDRLAERLARCT